jgi:hypothetical protein
MPWARTARRLEAPIASQAPTTAIIGHTHTMCRITDFTGRGVGPTSAVLGGGDRRIMFRSSCESCRFAAFRERERARFRFRRLSTQRLDLTRLQLQVIHRAALKIRRMRKWLRCFVVTHSIPHKIAANDSVCLRRAGRT